MSKPNGKIEAPAGATVHHVPIPAYLSKLGPVKAKAAMPKAAVKPLPGEDNPGVVENGNCAFWRVGNTLMMAVDISPETIAASVQPLNGKTGKLSPNKVVSQVKAESGFGAYDIGEGFKLNLWLGAKA